MEESDHLTPSEESKQEKQKLTFVYQNRRRDSGKDSFASQAKSE